MKKRSTSQKGRPAARKNATGAQHSSARKRKTARKSSLPVIVIAALIVIIAATATLLFRHKSTGYRSTGKTLITPRPEINVELLTVSPWSRPGIARTDAVDGVVIHWTANPGTTAEQNRGYFEGLKDSHITHASSHFIIGMDGEIVQCVPTNEIAYTSNSRNDDTVAIECCIQDSTGKFSDKTYQSCIQLTAFLMGKFNLTTDQVIRHYDITGKDCPKYFVDHPEAWTQFKKDLQSYIAEHGKTSQ